MKIPQDERFREERERYRLRFCCEDCGLFNEGDLRCIHGFPTVEHRELRYLDPSAALVYCKEFDLA